MAKLQAESQHQNYSGPPPRQGMDMPAVLTLGGVMVLLMISFANWREIDQIQENLDRRLDKIETEISQVGGRAPARAAAPSRSPDPNRVYAINTAGAPFKGPVGARSRSPSFRTFNDHSVRGSVRPSSKSKTSTATTSASFGNTFRWPCTRMRRRLIWPRWRPTNKTSSGNFMTSFSRTSGISS